jgi:HD superfamily phosphohydrolase
MTTPAFRQPDYLTEADHPRHRIRCPIHGFIRFSENERHIIDNRLFRRLRWIRQLALTELVYPGATHTRFEHSLGVMEVATRIFDALARSQGSVMEATFSTVEQLKDRPLAKARQLVRLAALLHDTGHCCFSLAAEEVIHKGSDHEALTVEILTNPAFLGNELTRIFFAGCPELTGKLIQPVGDFPLQLQVLRDIVSGQVDADRMDYLLRDSHHCGVDYGRFDSRRMVECLTLRQDSDRPGRLEIAIHRDGIHTFEALILARYQMNTQVYYHRLRRIYDLYLKEYFKARAADFGTPEKILYHNDLTMITAIIQDADRTGEPFQPWAARIRDRRHHRLVYESDEDAGVMLLQKVDSAFAKVKADYPDIDFRLDVAVVTIHKLLLPSDMESEGHVQFCVIDTDGTSEPLSQRSPILRQIPRKFRVARIFADLGRDQKPLQQEIAAKCKACTKT